MTRSLAFLSAAALLASAVHAQCLGAASGTLQTLVPIGGFAASDEGRTAPAVPFGFTFPMAGALPFAPGATHAYLSSNGELYLTNVTYGIFAPNVIATLRRPPMSQIWRDHLLSLALLRHSDRKYDEGCFVFLFPSLNKQCQDGVNEYAKYLASDDEKINGFCPRHLEQFIHTVADHYNTDWSNELRSRYLGAD